MDKIGQILSKFYDFCGVLAGACIATIAGIIFLEILLRFFGEQIPGFIEIAMFLLLAASFLSLAQTFRKNEHIRITVLIGRLPNRIRRWFEIWSLAASTFIFSTMGFYTVEMTLSSYKYHEMSDGVVGIPLWIPQVVMLVGILALTVSFVEELVRSLRGTLPIYLTHASSVPELEDILEEEATDAVSSQRGGEK